MATKFNARNIWASVKEFWNKMLEGIIWCLNKGLQVLAIILLTIIAILTVALVYNPIALPLWMLFRGFRREAAAFLFKGHEDRFDRAFTAVQRFLCCWEVKCFPWFMRRDFVRAYPQKFSVKDQVRAAKELADEEKEKFIKNLSDEAIGELWQFGSNDDRLAIAKGQYRMDSKTLQFLMSMQETTLIKEFIRRSTPAAACVNLLIKWSEANSSSSERAREILRFNVIKNGLTPEQINYVYDNDSANEDLIKLVEDALVKRNQYLMTKKLQNNNLENLVLWKGFCKQYSNIWVAAQKEMEYWQLEAFFASGHQLDDDAVMHHISKTSGITAKMSELISQNQKGITAKISELIFQNQKDITPKVMSAIRTLPDVYSIYLQIRVLPDTYKK